MYEFKNQIKKVISGELNINMIDIKNDYAKDKLQSRLINIIESIYKEKTNSKYIQKYINMLERKGVSTYKINEKISNLISYINDYKNFLFTKIDDEFECILIILLEDPIKQNVLEKFKYEFIHYNGWDIEKLNSIGKNSYYIYENNLMKGDDLRLNRSDSGCTKSMDFKINLKNSIIYVYDKTTEDSGGSQINQYNDALNFIKQAKFASIKRIN